jgi:two-component system, cell cycle sensor histidine kinase and response regulator CckA
MTSTIKVLLVEDNPGDALLIKEMLSEIDDEFQISHATGLAESLDSLDKNGFDVVLLDLCLPDSQGIDTFNTINSYAPDLPIIILTGLNDDIFAVTAVRRGAQDYLVKGEVNRRLLIRSIKYSMERKRIDKELNEMGEKLHLAQKAGGIGTFELNIKTDEVVWTEELENIYHLPIENFGGKFEDWIKLIYPEDRERVSDEFIRSIENKNDWFDFFRIIWPDDSIHWIKIQGTIIYDENNLPIRMIGVNFDVTDLI